MQATIDELRAKLDITIDDKEYDRLAGEIAKLEKVGRLVENQQRAAQLAAEQDRKQKRIDQLRRWEAEILDLDAELRDPDRAQTLADQVGSFVLMAIDRQSKAERARQLAEEYNRECEKYGLSMVRPYSSISVLDDGAAAICASYELAVSILVDRESRGDKQPYDLSRLPVSLLLRDNDGLTFDVEGFGSRAGHAWGK